METQRMRPWMFAALVALRKSLPRRFIFFYFQCHTFIELPLNHPRAGPIIRYGFDGEGSLRTAGHFVV